ncbi:MAG: hypothetical protein IT275_10690 [Chitinophagales bacterium]|nr:hypothetical protein [Chitinophagales bacterium]
MIHYSTSIYPPNIKWEIKTEPVYRLLNKVEYINNFFETGEIMVSCFSKFKEYKDEMQGDKDEGEALAWYMDSQGNVEAVKYASGINAFILSTAKTLNDRVKSDFKAKGAIKINNSTLFGYELCKQLPFVSSGVEGVCDYTDSRVRHINTDLSRKDKSGIFDFRNDSDYSRMILQQSTKGFELFNKLKKYSHQEEYRFIWFSENQITDSIKITCPNAIKYCEKIVF